MKLISWLIVISAIGGIALFFWKARERMRERARASEERFAAMMAEARPAQAPSNPPAAPAPNPVSPEQRLLFDAAGKAAEAGEPALSIQLYARLLARYPQSAFGAQARAAVELQKQRLAKP